MIPSKYVRTKSDTQAIEDGCTFDLKHAERVRDFCRQFIKLTIDEGQGKPLDFMPYQWDEIIVPLYSWRRQDGTRRFTQASVWVPKNNAKTCLTAALCLYELIASNTPSGNIAVVANTIEEADTLFKYMLDMVAQSPELTEALWCRENIRKIEYEATRSHLKVLSGDKGGKEGKPLSMLVYDEIGWADNRLMYEALRYNVNKRKNSLCITISTAGLRRESIGLEEFKRAEKILSGELIDTSVLPVVYTAPPD